MKMIYSKITNFVVSAALILGLTSCANELNIGPIDPEIDLEFRQDEVFAKLYATMALTGQEGPAGNGDVSGIDEGTSAFYRLIFSANEYPADLLHCAWTDDGVPELGAMKWSSSHGQIEGLYGRLNYDVTLCNHFLEKTDGLTDDISVRQRAEARFIRALNYYYLMDLFGNVPFTETVSSSLPEQIMRADLFEYIKGELEAIESDMYEPRTAPFGRADKAANWLLRARMYLNAEVYTGTPRWADAKTYSEKVIASPYELCPTYAHLFMADNDENPNAMQEIILPIRQDGMNIRSYGGAQFVICGTRVDGMTDWGSEDGWAGIRARRKLVDIFFPNSNPDLSWVETDMITAASDDRALFFAGGDRVLDISTPTSFKEGLSVSKWSNIRSDGGRSQHVLWVDTDIPFFRLGEAYLILAEAILRNGGLESDALDALNELRDRANADRLSNATLEVVLNERARELYCEGHRRTDLVRYGYFTGNTYNWDWKGGVAEGTSVASFYNLYPIPASDVNNGHLEQNPGY